MILAVLLGCPKPVETTLYPVAAPALEPLPPFEYPRADDTCDGPIPFLTGEPPPMVSSGRAICGGILVGDDEYAALVHGAEAELPWLRTYAAECAAGRERDRVWAQAAYDHEATVARELEAENRTLRRVGPVLFVAGVLLGGGIVVATTSVEVAVVNP